MSDDIGPHPTDDRLFHKPTRHRVGTDPLGRAKLRKLIARRKKQGRNTRDLEWKLATRPKVTPKDDL
jgi:hypothetical protein